MGSVPDPLKMPPSHPWPVLHRTAANRPPVSGEIAEVASSPLHAALELIRQAEVSVIEQPGDADEPGIRLRRRTLLLEASTALAVVAAAPMLEVPRIRVGKDCPITARNRGA